MQDLHVITRELINEMLTPEEEREWMTYTAYLPKQELAEAREHLVSARVIVQALIRLMNEGASPGCDAVQKLMLQNNQLMVRYRHRERLATRGNWNEAVTRKVHALGLRLVMKTAADDSVTESRVFDFCCEARTASKWGKALDEIAAEALALNASNAGARSQAAQALVQRFIEVCENFSLGDPVLYGRWYIEFGKMLAGDAWVSVDEPSRKAWTLLVEAVEASRQPAGMRTAAAW
ncbi:MAG: hypothetical protein WDO68_03200 [Gammaproteobacteria bacterium]